jgi:hypothetical protein
VGHADFQLKGMIYMPLKVGDIIPEVLLVQEIQKS